jgi:hypothetical protein
MGEFPTSVRARARSIAAAAALGTVAVMATATPPASAANITKSLVTTCKLYNAAGVFTDASVKLNLTLQAHIPDNIPQGATGFVTGAKARITLSGPSVGIAHSFGDQFTGSVTGFTFGLTNTTPATVNAAATPVAIPKQVLPVKKADGTYDALSFDVPTSGFLPDIGPITASGAPNSTITATLPASPTAIVTNLSFATTVNPTVLTNYQLRCRPDDFVDDDETIPQDLTLGTAKISDPVSYSPTHGPLSGGTLVNVKGAGVGTVTSVKAFGVSVPFTKVSDTEIAVVTPAYWAPGPVEVIGTNPDGFVKVTFNYDPNANAPVTAGAITPSHGPLAGGPSVITGTGLDSVTAVTVGGKAATLGTKSANSLAITVPAATAAGRVPVVLTSPLGNATSSYAYDPPVTTNLNKSLINTCKLYGADGVFTGASVALTLKIQAHIPEIVPQGGTGYVTNAKATATLGGPAIGIARAFGDKFSGQATSFGIAISNATPSTFDAAATPIDIPTQNLPAKKADGTYDALTFDVPTTGFLPNLGPFTASGAAGSKIVATFPNSATAMVANLTFQTTGDPTKTQSYQLRCRPNAFVDDDETVPQDLTLGSATINPAITFSPTHGPLSGGTVISVKGAGVGTVTSLSAFGVSVPFTKVSETELSVVTPAYWAAGPVDVIGTNPDGFLKVQFTYDADPAAAPVLTSIQPSHGALAGGNAAAVVGTGLSTVSSITVGGKPATLGAKTGTSVTFIVPAGTAAGAASVVVTNPSGSATTTYTYDAGTTPSPDAPKITRFLTKVVISNIGGITVVQGANFKGIKFVRVGGKTATFTVYSPTLMLVNLPKLPTGSYPMLITNAAGTNPTTIGSTVKYTPLH